MGSESLSVYVNGILSPKDEVHWTSMKRTLTRAFGGTVCHAHNPFIALNQEDILKLVSENPQVALAFAAVGVTSMMLAFSGSNNSKSLEILAKAMEGILYERAQSFVPTLHAFIRDILLENAKLHGRKGDPKYVRVNLIGHSHGGMCINQYLRSHLPNQLREQHGIQFRVYIVGCPIAVTPYNSIIDDIVQIHNVNDAISLLFETAERLPDHVVSVSLHGMHDSLLYAQALANNLRHRYRHSEL
mmetsp:Transcript_6153/g.7076  ORF Transcript_6153/g.7076 Transcript_6153/m.7076 type:complete len:244 (-) Transcript_6153:351-1082(-)